MKFDKHPFAESNGVFSWRKAGTAIVFFVFGYACIGYGHKHNFNELPMSYISIIAGVFTFYFLKETVRGIKVTKKENDENNS
jgi:ABC-type uncharacterized transport system permease subunit